MFRLIISVISGILGGILIGALASLAFGADSVLVHVFGVLGGIGTLTLSLRLMS
jgi:hypothetical protein